MLKTFNNNVEYLFYYSFSSSEDVVSLKGNHRTDLLTILDELFQAKRFAGYGEKQHNFILKIS